MAFISSVTAHVTVPAPNSTTPDVCNVKQTVFRALRASAAALVVTATLFIETPALAQDDVLVFDHDQSLTGANFENRKDLRGAIFSKANCRSSSFMGSDLSNAQLDDANVCLSFSSTCSRSTDCKISS